MPRPELSGTACSPRQWPVVQTAWYRRKSCSYTMGMSLSFLDVSSPSNGSQPPGFCFLPSATLQRPSAIRPRSQSPLPSQTPAISEVPGPSTWGARNPSLGGLPRHSGAGFLCLPGPVQPAHECLWASLFLWPVPPRGPGLDLGAGSHPSGPPLCTCSFHLGFPEGGVAGLSSPIVGTKGSRLVSSWASDMLFSLERNRSGQCTGLLQIREGDSE